MKEGLVRVGAAAALVAVLGAAAATSAAAEEVTVGDVTVVVPGLTISTGTGVSPVVIGDDDENGNGATAGSTTVNVQR